MSMMTVCPECKAQVGVPAGTHPTAQVRCPLCEVEFSFGESIPDDLPEVVVVDPGFAEPAAETAALAGAVQEAEEAAAQTGEETVDDMAVQTGEGAIEEAQWFTPDTPDTPDTGDETVESGFSFDPFGDSDSSDDDKKDDSEKAVGEGGEKEGGGVATADGDDETTGEPSFSFSPFGDSDSDGDGDERDFGGASFGESSGEGGAATATAAKPKKKGMSLKGQVIGIVVFGIIGLGLGYGILKMVKPAAAAPFDNMFVGAWNSVASLWGGGSAGDQTAATTGGGETGKPQGSNPGSTDDDFKIGGMLPQDQQPTDTDLANIGGADSSDDAAANGTTDGQDDVFPSQPPKPSFRDLLGGLSDPASVFQDVTFDEVDTAITKASQEQGINRYLAMCDVGEKLANADNSGAQFEQLSSACQASALISAESIGEENLENASYKWLRNRPAAYRDRDGIFLLGRVSKVRNGAMVGSLFATEIEIKKSARVILLTTSDPNLRNGDKVAVLGTLVEDAVSRLPGYSPTDVTDKFEGADPSNLVLGAVVVKSP